MWSIIEKLETESFFTVYEQTRLFLLSVAMGAVFGIIFDIFRALRVIFPFLKKNIPTIICDILFVIICGLGIYFFSLVFARGEVRMYYAAGALLGMIIYLMTAGTVIMGIIRSFFGFIYSAVHGLWKFIAKRIKLRTK